MFPYAIASVCLLWRDIMLSVPMFWERLMILVDSPATPLSAVVSYLSWFRGRQIDDVTITRRWDSDDPVDGRHERSQIMAIMNMLGSHIHLVDELIFDVTFSPSLPSSPTDFRVAASDLMCLGLRCKDDDGGPGNSTRVASSIPELIILEYPTLISLAIDGRNYYELCRRDFRWTDEIASVKGMIISHFKPRLGESFSSYEFLPASRHL